MRKKNFCTLFDSSFLARGLTLYSSLINHCQDFHLYIYAFDELCYEILINLNLEKVSVISLQDFEDEKLLNVKPYRSKGEYCWTCTPSVILHSIQKFNLDHCTYLDSDIFFFSSPDKLLTDFLNGPDSTLITPHNYTRVYDQSVTSGIYCVQFMPFKNNKTALKILSWWREECIKWCYARSEDGKFGDQKYLDSWPEQFDEVYVDKNFGLGLAPWNVQQVRIFKNSKQTLFNHPQRGTGEVIFYHFHSLKFYKNLNQPWLGWYYLNIDIINIIYKPYFEALAQSVELFNLNKTKANFMGFIDYKPNINDLLQFLKSRYKFLINNFFKHS